ncbi:hypothetical protein JRQ81_009478 [Phrynocephalus forsythii]|uniref:Beta-1,4-glucuronyltransferase 1 n=1 Tax=Phrynocephalus forsythii TaxID=171643 RepID=A0A9Q1ASJ5_9SAUR|nr:hypothetical protein JRQ81_009478 [Phrynocephalus forsythii]
MHCSCFQALVAALALVAGLQLLYLGLLSGLHGRDQRSHYYAALFQAGSPGRPWPWEAHRERLRRALASGGSLDAGGQYRIYRDVLRGAWEVEEEEEGEGGTGSSQDVVLATHTSLGNLHHAQQLGERWQGPVSLALFAPGAADAHLAVGIVEALATLCPPFRQWFRLHLPGLRPAGTARGRAPELCQGRCQRLLPQQPAAQCRPEAVGRHWALVVDMDMVPSQGLREAFLALPRARQEGTPGVYVVPAFEIRHARRIPGTKAELLQLYQVGEIRPFYEELCRRCQAPTNYSHWLNLPAGGPLRVAYQVEWRDPWEPFYIGASSVPPYDERFKQYGFNRISQACELHVAGYRFSVLSNAFLVHKGFKVASEFHAQKDAENQHNKILFRQFKQDLKAKYPTTSRRC